MRYQYTLILVFLLFLGATDVYGKNRDKEFRKRCLRKMEEYRNRIRNWNIKVTKSLPLISTSKVMLRSGEWFCGCNEYVDKEYEGDKIIERAKKAIKANVVSTKNDYTNTMYVVNLKCVNDDGYVILETEHVKLVFSKNVFLESLKKRIERWKHRDDIGLRDVLYKKFQKKKSVCLNGIRGTKQSQYEERAGFIMEELLDAGQAQIYCNKEQKYVSKIIKEYEQFEGFLCGQGGNAYYTPCGQRFLYILEWIS